MRKNGFVFRTRQRNRRAGLLVTEQPTDDYADEYDDEPAEKKLERNSRFGA